MQAVPVVDLVESNDHDSIDNVADIIQGEERGTPIVRHAEYCTYFTYFFRSTCANKQ